MKIHGHILRYKNILILTLISVGDVAFSNYIAESTIANLVR